MPSGTAEIAIDNEGGFWALYANGGLEYRKNQQVSSYPLFDHELNGQQLIYIPGQPDKLFIYAYIKGDGRYDETPDILLHFFEFDIDRSQAGTS